MSIELLLARCATGPCAIPYWTLCNSLIIIASMKKRKYFFVAFLVGASLAIGHMGMAAEEAKPRASWEQEMGRDLQKDVRAAEQEMKKEGQELTRAAENLAVSPAPAQQADTQATPPGQSTSKKSMSDAQRQQPMLDTRAAADPRQQALQGSPETGYAGTWKDPETGDIITSVIAPLPKPDNTQNYPILIEPQVSGNSWQTNSDSWGPIWNGGSSGWQPGWPQWPGYPGDTGTPPPPPPGAPGMKPFPPGMPPVPPGVPPNQPYNPAFPTHNPYNPSWTPFPPPEHPGYRPLRPNNPSVWKPGQPGGPGMRPPQNQDWHPNTPPPNPGFRPGISPNPGFRPLPMRPGGQTWQHGIGSGGAGGPGFGPGPR